MNFLTPLYILGALTVAAPVVFHLIRRTTRGEVPFSSLLFLAPSPPRLTRRSRLEHWPLLLLRASVLVLLAAAFARPFLRRASGLSLGGAERGRVVVLIDTSASMRRGDLWAQARARAVEAVAACRPDDQLAVFAFDASTRRVLGFDESSPLDSSRRLALATSRVGRLAPGWGATNLGRALVDAAGAIEDVGDAARKSAKVRRRIVLVSDLQQGSRLDELGAFEWPSDVELELKTVSTGGSNAGLQRVPGPDADGPPAAGASNDVRVRVSNDAASTAESFRLSWAGETAPAVPVYVPPGESRVVRVPLPTGAPSGRTLRLQGDAHGFDNDLYFAPEAKESAAVLYVGRDAPDDPSGLLYYLNRVFPNTPRRAVTVEARAPSDPLTFEPGRSVPLAVVAGETTAGNAAALRRLARAGGTVLFVATAPGKAPTLAALADAPAVDVGDGPARGDTMLAEVAFDHPLFAPFAAPQFNDFTKIKFWKYRRVPTAPLGDVRVPARFETGDPALIEKTLGKGRLVVLSSGWNPADSQLARSSKFVPLMSALLDGPGAGPDLSADRVVLEPVPLPEGSVAVRKPDGSTARPAPGASAFSEADAPGVYAVETAKGPRAFAVNLDPAEGKTSPLGVETLERFGCRLAAGAARAEAEREAFRQMQNAELEGRQKLWRPLVVAAIAALIVETWLAGRLGRPSPHRSEAPVS